MSKKIMFVCSILLVLAFTLSACAKTPAAVATN